MKSLKTRVRSALLASLAVVAAGPVVAMGVVPGELDGAFANPNIDGPVYATPLQADGKIVIGGTFTSVSGQTRQRVARLNADGSLDAGMNPTTNGTVVSTTVLADGKVLIAGVFDIVASQNRVALARLDASGALDAAFNANLGLNSTVLTTQALADGRRIIGGNFVSVGGQTRNRVARLNADGSLDAGFIDPNVTGGGVTESAIEPDGKIIIGGQFTSVGGQTRNYLARLNADGSLDTSFDPNPWDTVESLARQPDGKIIIGGDFTTIVGQPRDRVARLNADGSLDTSFTASSNSTVESIALQADGKIILGGAFTMVSGQPRNRVARLNADGSLDTSFDPSVDGTVYSTAIQPDGKVNVAGYFTSVRGQSRTSVARIHATTPQVAPQGARATAGQGRATVSWSSVIGDISGYTATASPGGRSCTTTTTACDVTGLTGGTTYTFTVAAANAFGSGPASDASNSVTPSAAGTSPAAGAAVIRPRSLAGRFALNRKTRVGTTTGTVPAGASRIAQTASTGVAARAATQGFLEMARAKTATGACAITVVRNKKTKKAIKRTYRCRIKLAKGTWAVTTTARGAAGIVAEGTRRVAVR